MALENTQLHLVENNHDRNNFYEWATTTNDPIAFDVETTGLNPQKDQIRLMQFGDEKDGWAIPATGSDNFDTISATIEQLAGNGTRFIAHNARFDTAFLSAAGISIPRHLIEDTMIAAHILDPNRSIALKTLTAKHVDKNAAAAQSKLDHIMQENGWTWATIPIESTGSAAMYWQYGALDVILTAHLWNVLNHQLEDTDQVPAYQLDMASMWNAEHIQNTGIKFDRDQLKSEGFKSKQHLRLADSITKNLSTGDRLRPKVISHGSTRSITDARASVPYTEQPDLGKLWNGPGSGPMLRNCMTVSGNRDLYVINFASLLNLKENFYGYKVSPFTGRHCHTIGNSPLLPAVMAVEVMKIKLMDIIRSFPVVAWFDFHIIVEVDLTKYEKLLEIICIPVNHIEVASYISIRNLHDDPWEEA